MVRQHPEFGLHDINESLEKRNIPGRRSSDIKDLKIKENVPSSKQRRAREELGLQLYNVGSLYSLIQVPGSSVETSSCLLDLTQHLLKDPTDATETSVLVQTRRCVQKARDSQKVVASTRT